MDILEWNLHNFIWCKNYKSYWLTNWSILIYLVYDGHSGVKAAASSAINLHNKLIGSASFPSSIHDAIQQAVDNTDQVNFHLCNNNLWSQLQVTTSRGFCFEKLYISLNDWFKQLQSYCLLTFVWQGKSSKVTTHHPIFWRYKKLGIL